MTKQTTTTQAIPSWAIVMAILFFLFCLLGLFFLLAKEERMTGYVQVTVQGDHLYHATQVPVSNMGQVADVEARVNYIRGLVTSAS